MKWLFSCILFGISLLSLGCSKSPKPDSKPDSDNKFASASEVNIRLGRGINIGNTYEGDIHWGKSLDKNYLKIIAGLGFRHVRLPIRWNRSDRASASAPFMIHPAFLSEIQSVVEEALRNKLHIIINVHHDDELNADPLTHKERFLSYWKQISSYFKNYPDSVLFEVLNEPHSQLTPIVWNDILPQALNVIRQSNPQRCVLISGAEWGGVAGLPKLLVPADEHLILTVHYYNPFMFTHQGAEWVDNSAPWLGTKWYDTQVERNTVAEDFKATISFAKEKKLPVHIGEFGSYSKADMDARVRWTRYLARYFEQQGWSWAYWEFYAGFGIYDPVAQQLRTPLTNALLKDAMPPPYEPTVVHTLYTSNFANNSDGWNLYNNDASAASSLQVANGKMNVTITKPGTANYHIQLIKRGVSIVAGKTYLVNFNASAEAPKIIYATISKGSSPWTVYSSSNSFSITPTDGAYGFLFNATIDDTNATMVISMGNAGISGVAIHNVSIKEVSL